MCVFIGKADARNTVIMGNRFYHPKAKDSTAVAYGNNVRNRNLTGANAMILSFPSRYPMTASNFINTSSFSHFMDDLVEAALPPMRGEYLAGAKSPSFGAIEVFNYDIYTVILTGDAKLIPMVLNSDVIPENRRPDLDPGLFDWYATQKHGDSFAVACFDNQDEAVANPFLVWYPNRDSRFIELPGWDAHTGSAPENGLVDVDHTIVLGSYLMRGGNEVFYRDNIPSWAKMFLPKRVIGKSYSGKLPNGDFVYESDDVERFMSMSRLVRR